MLDFESQSNITGAESLGEFHKRQVSKCRLRGLAAVPNKNARSRQKPEGIHLIDWIRG